MNAVHILFCSFSRLLELDETISSPRRSFAKETFWLCVEVSSRETNCSSTVDQATASSVSAVLLFLKLNIKFLFKFSPLGKISSLNITWLIRIYGVANDDTDPLDLVSCCQQNLAHLSQLCLHWE